MAAVFPVAPYPAVMLVCGPFGQAKLLQCLGLICSWFDTDKDMINLHDTPFRGLTRPPPLNPPDEIPLPSISVSGEPAIWCREAAHWADESSPTLCAVPALCGVRRGLRRHAPCASPAPLQTHGLQHRHRYRLPATIELLILMGREERMQRIAPIAQQIPSGSRSLSGVELQVTCEVRITIQAATGSWYRPRQHIFQR